jgi:conjugal transfer mating pair stabilization protein TraG
MSGQSPFVEQSFAEPLPAVEAQLSRSLLLEQACAVPLTPDERGQLPMADTAPEPQSGHHGHNLQRVGAALAVVSAIAMGASTEAAAAVTHHQESASVSLMAERLKHAGTKVGNMVYYNQTDPRWEHHPYHDKESKGDIGLDGCGATALAMVVSTMTGKKVTPPEIADYNMKHGYVYGAATSWKGLRAVPEHYGLRTHKIDLNIKSVQNVLDKNGLVLINGTDENLITPATSAGHIMVIRGINKVGGFLIADPDSLEHSKIAWKPEHILAPASYANAVLPAKPNTSPKDSAHAHHHHHQHHHHEAPNASSGHSPASKPPTPAHTKSPSPTSVPPLPSALSGISVPDTAGHGANHNTAKPKSDLSLPDLTGGSLPLLDQTAESAAQPQHKSPSADQPESKTGHETANQAGTTSPTHATSQPRAPSASPTPTTSTHPSESSPKSSETQPSKPARPAEAYPSSPLPEPTPTETQSPKPPRPSHEPSKTPDQPSKTPKQTSGSPDASASHTSIPDIVGSSGTTQLAPETSGSSDGASDKRSGGQAKSDGKEIDSSKSASTDSQKPHTDIKVPTIATPEQLGLVVSQLPGADDVTITKGSAHKTTAPETTSHPTPHSAAPKSPDKDETNHSAKHKSSNVAKHEALLDFIAVHESDGNYNAYYGSEHNSKIDFTSMSIAKVLRWQHHFVAEGSPSSAVGKYQILDKTLNSLVSDLDIDPQKKFDKQMQDKLGNALLQYCGLKEYVDGKISDKQFAHNLSLEWASLPNVYGAHPEASHYAGDGLNHAFVSVHEIISAVDKVKK